MKIGIAAPCPQPFVIGGAEKLWWSLATYINAATPHQADIIKLPVSEDDFWSLIDGYERFARLDLSAFDVVVSGKYPAWMIHHPRHVVYMLHPARGLYEGYAGRALEQARPDLDTQTRGLLDWLQAQTPAREKVDEAFARLAELRSNLHMQGAEPLEWPGPVTRQVIHWLDAAALAPHAIAQYAAISHAIAARPSYFPPGTRVAVAHPPSDLVLAPTPHFRYFLSVGRLEPYKRVDLIVEAMRQVEGDVELWIAGSGPERNRLEALGAGDSRIRFLGFVNDKALADLYRDALAVAFVPFQEDYGLVAVEAMMAGKPVLSTTDAGGPTELVRDGESGYIVPPTASAVAQAMQRLAADRTLAERLGARGRERAEQVTWQKVLDAILPKRLVDNAMRRASHAGEAAAGCSEWIARLRYLEPEERKQHRKYIKLESPLVIVIGCAAASQERIAALCALARQRPHIAFIASSTMPRALEPGAIPANLALPGPPSHVGMEILCELADLALCLEGTDAKSETMLLACFASGVPVIATGDAQAACTHADATLWHVSSIEEIPATIDRLLDEPARAQSIAAAAHRFVLSP